MWPFKKKPKIEYLEAAELNFTQVDFTERFGDHLSLSEDEWIETIPMNRTFPDGKGGNLPPIDAIGDEIYRIASRLSEIRESFRVPTDGVYCPVCHIANIDYAHLRNPCPKCGRPLLAFDWN
jgi:hypothetical protein